MISTACIFDNLLRRSRARFELAHDDAVHVAAECRSPKKLTKVDIGCARWTESQKGKAIYIFTSSTPGKPGQEKALVYDI